MSHCAILTWQHELICSGVPHHNFSVHKMGYEAWQLTFGPLSAQDWKSHTNIRYGWLCWGHFWPKFRLLWNVYNHCFGPLSNQLNLLIYYLFKTDIFTWNSSQWTVYFQESLYYFLCEMKKKKMAASIYLRNVNFRGSKDLLAFLFQQSTCLYAGHETGDSWTPRLLEAFEQIYAYSLYPLRSDIVFSTDP